MYSEVPLICSNFYYLFWFSPIRIYKGSILWVVLKKPYWCAVIAFALNTGAYTSEIFRSGFEKIDQNLIEAANSLGLNKFKTFLTITLPIGIKRSVPAYGNEMILMLKGTSLASTVTLLDLTGTAKYIISTHFNPVEVFVFVGSIYLFFTFLIHIFVKYLEKKFRYY